MANNRITFKGKPLALYGQTPAPGGRAPDFTVLDKDLNEVPLGWFRGKVKVISSVLSLDTSVCHRQLVRFNSGAAKLGPEVAVLNISMDLPFALARFIEEEQIRDAVVLSDHRDASFGKAYGLLIERMRLLARAVMVIDRDDTIRYVQVVPEQTNEPDYGQAISEVEKLLVKVS